MSSAAGQECDIQIFLYFSRTARKSLAQIRSNIYFSLVIEIKLSSSLLNFSSQIVVYVKLVQILFLFAWQRKRKKLYSKLKAKAIIPSCIFGFCDKEAGLVRKAKFYFLRSMKTLANFLHPSLEVIDPILLPWSSWQSNLRAKTSLNNCSLISQLSVISAI